MLKDLVSKKALLIQYLYTSVIPRVHRLLRKLVKLLIEYVFVSIMRMIFHFVFVLMKRFDQDLACDTRNRLLKFSRGFYVVCALCCAIQNRMKSAILFLKQQLLLPFPLPSNQLQV